MNSKDKKTLLRLLDIQIRQLGPHLERAGVPSHAYALPEGEPPEQSLEKASRFLLMVTESPEFMDVLKARELVPESTWRDYELYEFTGFQEQVIYANALRELKRLWNTNRPTFFGKDYRPKDAAQGSEAGDRRPEERPDAASAD